MNDAVVRLGVIDGDFHWHKHDEEDEFFLVLEGELVIEVEARRRSGPAAPRIHRAEGRDAQDQRARPRRDPDGRVGGRRAHGRLSASSAIPHDRLATATVRDEFPPARELNLANGAVSRRRRCSMPDVTVKSIDDMEAIYGGSRARAR